MDNLKPKVLTLDNLKPAKVQFTTEHSPSQFVLQTANFRNPFNLQYEDDSLVTWPQLNLWVD